MNQKDATVKRKGQGVKYSKKRKFEAGESFEENTVENKQNPGPFIKIDHRGKMLDVCKKCLYTHLVCSFSWKFSLKQIAAISSINTSKSLANLKSDLAIFHMSARILIILYCCLICYGGENILRPAYREKKGTRC